MTQRSLPPRHAQQTEGRPQRTEGRRAAPAAPARPYAGHCETTAVHRIDLIPSSSTNAATVVWAGVVMGLKAPLFGVSDEPPYGTRCRERGTSSRRQGTSHCKMSEQF
jgi:hypothetical protein